MKKRHQAGKKIAAWLMALSLCMTAVPAEQVVYAAGGQNETEVTELTENPETAENTEALDDSETAESEDTEDNGEENTSEAVETDSTENESETTENTESVKDTEATESTEGSSHEECSVCGYQKAAVVIPVTGKEETTNEQPSNTNTLTVGQVVVNKADGSFYTIKKNAGKVHEVEYKAPKNKKQTKIAVPDSIKINGATYKVTSIAKSAFKNNKKLKTVTIGKNVSKIGENVFSGCKKLKTITIKSTKLKAKTLSKSTFKGITKATTVKVPKKKLSAYKKLFKSRGLSSKVKVKAY